MAKTFSFDISSDFDKAELRNAIEQTKRQILSRYDFKGTPANIELFEDHIKISGLEHQLDVILEILRTCLAKRNLNQKVLDTSSQKTAQNPWVWKLGLRSGIDQLTAKKISKIIRDVAPKVKPLINGETLRVSGSSKDELQQAIEAVRKLDLDQPINFSNFK